MQQIARTGRVPPRVAPRVRKRHATAGQHGREIRLQSLHATKKVVGNPFQAEEIGLRCPVHVHLDCSLLADGLEKPPEGNVRVGPVAELRQIDASRLLAATALLEVAGQGTRVGVAHEREAKELRALHGRIKQGHVGERRHQRGAFRVMGIGGDQLVIAVDLVPLQHRQDRRAGRLRHRQVHKAVSARQVQQPIGNSRPAIEVPRKLAAIAELIEPIAKPAHCSSPFKHSVCR